MLRAPRLVAAVLVGIAFLAVSLLLASGLTAPGRERSAVRDVVASQARGDAGGMLRELPRCARQPACVREVERLAASLRRPGDLQILRYDASSQLVLTEALGYARIAWRTGAAPPVVQCVRVKRTGPLDGARVELLTISPPVRRAGPCTG